MTADSPESLPSVSCMCLTYGRVDLLEEAIYSFLQQDYQGPKELVILNDLKEQTLVFEHPEVRLINLPQRIKPLGDKRNLCAEACHYDLLFPWDDDDIYLPNRLSYSVNQRRELGVDFFKPDRGYNWNNGQIDNLTRNTFHSQSCFSRQLFDSLGGYASMGSGEDQEFEQRVAEKGQPLFYPVDVQDYFYIYRWAGIEFYHISAFGMDAEDKPVSGEQRVGQIIKTALLSGAIPSGEISLQPRWKDDYLAQKQAYDAHYAGQETVSEAGV